MVERDLRTRRLGRPLIYKLRTTSTMDDARRAADAGAEEGTVVLAEEQTAGRGTQGRKWVSPAGQNLYFTIVLRPRAEQERRLSMIAPLAIANAVEQVLGLYPRIKWPNDLHLRGKKFAGILVENEWVGDRPLYALVGIGLNVNFDPALHASEIDRSATSLALERGRPTLREPLLAAILTSFERAYDAPSHPALLNGWRSRLETLGHAVTITNAIGTDGAGQVTEGMAEDVTEEGGLVVRLTDGTQRVVHAGEVSLRPPAQPTAPR